MRIGEFASHTGINVETVRYYQREGLLSIPKTVGTYRQYNQQHIDTIAFIQRAKSAGFTLEEIKRLQSLNDIRDKATIRAVSEEKLEQLNSKIDELLSAKSFLNTLIQDCKNSESKSCPILKTLKGN